MTLKEIFIRARKSANLTQQEFSSLLGLTTNTIGAIETGKTKHIKSATITALADFLNVSELALVKVINGELECSWEELLTKQHEPLPFLSDSGKHYKICRFIDSSNDTYDLTIERANDTDFYITTNRRDHRHQILLIPFETLNYKDSSSGRNIENEADLYGRLMVAASTAKKLTTFRSVWILFDKNNTEENNFYDTFSAKPKIAYFAKVDYVLSDYENGEIVKQTRITM